MTDQEDDFDENEAAKAFYRVRQMLGYLGYAFPIILIIGALVSGNQVEPSMSDFFHTPVRDLFVGTLCAIGIFLVSYKGYKKKDDDLVGDNFLATIAGVSAFGVAFFPNEGWKEKNIENMQTIGQAVGMEISPFFHYASALIFFAALAYFCLAKFTKTKSRPKAIPVYLWCGWIIAACCVLILLVSLVKKIGPPYWQGLVIDWDVVFWVETIGIWAFATSWLVKGKGDKDILRRLRRSRAKIKRRISGAANNS